MKTSIIFAKEFLLCSSELSPNELFINPNTDTSPGGISDYMYITEGGGTINGDTVGIGLHDLRSINSTKITYVGGPFGAKGVCINPINQNKFSVEVFTNDFEVISKVENEKILLVVQGEAMANNTLIPTFGTALCPPNVSVSVKVLINSVVMLLSREVI